MFVVDTNVLLYAADTSCPEHERCRQFVEQWRRQAEPWFITWGIVYEFLRGRHPPARLPGAHAGEGCMALH